MFAIFSFKWYLNSFVLFYIGVNSITALKLSAIVHRILIKKKLSFLDSFYVSAVAVYLYFTRIYDILFSAIFLAVKGMKTAQMFLEDCVGPSKSAI